jgi:hypothetical protein
MVVNGRGIPLPDYRDFALIECEYVRREILPDFDWTCFDAPSCPKPHHASSAVRTASGDTPWGGDPT